MEVEFLGGAREVGRSAVPVDDALLIDYGLLTADPPQYPATATPNPTRWWSRTATLTTSARCRLS